MLGSYIEPLLAMGVVPAGRFRFLPMASNLTVSAALFSGERNLAAPPYGHLAACTSQHADGHARMHISHISRPRRCSYTQTHPSARLNLPHSCSHTPSLCAAVAQVHATAVYTVVSSHRFSNVMSGDRSWRLARAAFSPDGPIVHAKRTLIVLIRRSLSEGRNIGNEPEVIAVLEQAASHYRPRSLISHYLGGRAPFRVVTWRPHASRAIDDLQLFRHAALVVGAHGAGLANLLFAAEFTPVIEVCHDNYGATELRHVCTDIICPSMWCPPMYAALAANLHHPYWVITGAGGFTTPIKVDIGALRSATHQALQTFESLSPQHGAAASTSPRAHDEHERGTAMGAAEQRPVPPRQTISEMPDALQRLRTSDHVTALACAVPAMPL